MSHTCPECQREFKSRRGLALHFSRIHKEKKLPPVPLDPQEYSFLCQICNTRRFKSQRGLSYHISKTHGVKFELSKEERARRQAEATRRFHIRRRKAQPQIYKLKCPMCEFRAINEGGLSSHMTKMHPDYIYFDRPIHVGFSAAKISRGPRAPYDVETMKWLKHSSNKNLLAFCLNNGTYRGLVSSLKRNKIIKNNWRWKGGYNMTTYGEELLAELQKEGRVSARIIAREIK